MCVSDDQFLSILVLLFLSFDRLWIGLMPAKLPLISSAFVLQFLLMVKQHLFFCVVLYFAGDQISLSCPFSINDCRQFFCLRLNSLTFSFYRFNLILVVSFKLFIFNRFLLYRLFFAKLIRVKFSPFFMMETINDFI